MKLSFLVVGPPKSATTYVDSILRTSTDLALPKIKETNYLVSDQIDPGRGYRVTDERKYLRLFKSTTGRFFGEVCPSYFYFADSVISHSLTSERTRYVICLRDPLKRAISHYFMDLNKYQMELPSPEVALQEERALKYSAWGSGMNPFLGLSDYQKYLDPYMSLGSGRVLLLFAEYSDNEKISKLQEFLGVNINADLVEIDKNNQATARSLLNKRFVSSDILRALYDNSPEYVRKLAKTLIYKKTEQNVYKNRSAELYNTFSKNSLWAPRIRNYQCIFDRYSS